MDDTHQSFRKGILHLRIDRIGQILLHHMNKRVDHPVRHLACGERVSHFRVQHREFREYQRTGKIQFLTSRDTGDNRTFVHLRTGRSQCKHRTQRQGALYLAAFRKDIPRIAFETDRYRDELRSVDHRTAAYGQQKINLLLFDDLHGLHAGFVMRICFDSRKLGHFKTFQRLCHLAVDAVFLYASAAIHHQHFTSFRNQSGQTGYGTFAENNLYRVTKLKIIHGSYFELKPLNFISVSIFLVFRGKSPFIIQE